VRPKQNANDSDDEGDSYEDDDAEYEMMDDEEGE
jgi:hypothetical protein